MADLDRYDLDPGYIGRCDFCGEDVTDEDRTIGSNHFECWKEARDESAVYFSAKCYCSTRATRRLEGLSDEFECKNGHRFLIRVTVDGLVPMTPFEARRFDERRRHPELRRSRSGGTSLLQSGASPSERPAPPSFDLSESPSTK